MINKILILIVILAFVFGLNYFLSYGNKDLAKSMQPEIDQRCADERVKEHIKDASLKCYVTEQIGLGGEKSFFFRFEK